MRLVTQSQTELPTYSTKQNGVWTGFINCIRRPMSYSIKLPTTEITSALSCRIKILLITVGAKIVIDRRRHACAAAPRTLDVLAHAFLRCR